jgi:hypothetical protein
MKQTKKSAPKKPVTRKSVNKNPELFFVPPDRCKNLTEMAATFSHKFKGKPKGIHLAKDELTVAALQLHFAANIVQVCSLTAIE